MHVVEAAKRLWAAPCTALGLVIGAVPLAFGGRLARADGTLEITHRERLAECGLIARALPFRAIVFGHVILAVTGEELERIRGHERVHVAQYERWGALFILAYGASGLWQLLRGRRPYWDNAFEVEARRLEAASAFAQARVEPACTFGGPP
jgi:hypothetical protein